MIIDEDRPWLRTPVSEELVIAGSEGVTGQRGICASLGRGQSAVAWLERVPEARITCHFLDMFAATEAQDFFADENPGIEVSCAADFPVAEYDFALLPVSRGGESELTRDYLQQAYHLLKPGGTLICAVDNPKDSWLHHELEKLGKSLTRIPHRKGVIYRLKKKEPLKKLKEFMYEFAFRDGEQLVNVVSRPGVFSHRQVDGGARAILEAVQVTAGEKVLEIGCGSGAVSLALALRAPGVIVHGIDTNPRAIQCLLQGAALNSLTTISGTLSDTGQVPGGRDFDLAVGNPPYYSHFKIAEIFLQAALRGVREGGRIAMVTKQEEWFVARMKQLFKHVESEPVRDYIVVRAIRK